ncbi:MAG: hypothetical protein LBT91_03425 [Bifidobacteriaceae bacterium]|jgi:hypothetical protein|nr:hypothetical protein [Bifidobacteriaceae bacterium]
MNTTINELFNIRNKGIKKAYIKRLGVKKLGVWGIIFLLCTATFISGFSINSYAASSSTVLPIARGGTNANTAAQASSNILGSNFANYSGVLPAAKGGTGSDQSSFGMAAHNLNSLPRYTYPMGSPFWIVEKAYIKVGEMELTESYPKIMNAQDIYITGFFNAYPETLYPQDYMLSIKAKNNNSVPVENATISDVYVYFKGFSLNCSPDRQIGYYTVGPKESDPEKAVLKIWLWKGSTWEVVPTLTWFWYGTYARTVERFSPEHRITNNQTDIPEGAAKIYPHCVTYASPSPTPTPTDSPTP